MTINFSCPISGEQQDNTTVRFVAGFVFVISGIALLVSARIGVLFSVVTTILYGIQRKAVYQTSLNLV